MAKLFLDNCGAENEMHSVTGLIAVNKTFDPLGHQGSWA